MSDWSLTNPDLRNYQDYDDNFECFNDWLGREPSNGRQSPAYSVRRDASPDRNNRENAPAQTQQDQRQPQGRSTSRVRQTDVRSRSLSIPRGQTLEPQVQNRNQRRPENQVRNEPEVGRVQQEFRS